MRRKEGAYMIVIVVVVERLPEARGGFNREMNGIHSRFGNWTVFNIRQTGA